jgi:hypothetical protein
VVENFDLGQKERMQALTSNVLILRTRVTLLAVVVSFLASVLLASKSFAVTVNTSTNKSIMSADMVPKEKDEKSTTLNASIDMSRSTSLYDHQDGSRSDSLDFRFTGIVGLPIGHTISTVIDYSNDLNDPENTAAGLVDPSLKYSFKSRDWAWSAPYVLTFRPSLSTVIPVTKRSVDRDQLQGLLSGGIAFGIKPDGIYNSDGVWTVLVGLTAGRNFHKFEENINGTVLNQYSSNQSLDIAYDIAGFSFSVSYLHRTRWTYQGNIRDSFVLGQEIAYGLSDNFSINMGHSNEGSMIKANGYESNLDVVDEDNSSVYLGINASI